MEKDTKDTINKSLLLNWLSSADNDVALEDLGRWLLAKTGGEYVLIKNNKENITKCLDDIINNSNQ